MRRFSEKQPLSTLTEINITPLLDLAFVLLVIFMITTPMLENSMDIALPTSQTASPQVDASKVHTVNLGKEDSLKLDKEPIALADLESRLRQLKAADPTTAVAIRAEKSLEVQKLISVMDAVQRAGISRVGVMTRPPETP